jgi:hypothetical protein
MLLPWIVAILYCIENKYFPQSISATYYAVSCITPFMIILGAAGLLLLTYNGYNKQDRIVCSIAGIMGLCVCIFPCSATTADYVGTFMLPTEVSGWIHNISAVIFFALLAYNSYFLFTKSAGEMTDNKRRRNIIFKVCGIGMLASFVLLIPFLILDVRVGMWIVEAIALLFFGVSWLTKSQCYSWLFKD